MTPDPSHTSAAPRLAIVVLTWNGRDDTLACLGSLAGQLGADDRVLVADNGSTDGTVAAVRATFPWAEVLENGANLGFAGGNDVALRVALARGYRWVLLLNNDTVVPPGALAALLAYAATRPGTAAFQPLLVRAAEPTTIDSAGHVVFRVPGAADGLAGSPVAAAPAAPVEVFGACGAAALVRADVLGAVGLLDERLFVLFEDVDWMFRLRCAGHAVELVPGVRVLHRRGVSGGGRPGPAARRRKFWLHRNTLALALRYWPWRWLLLAAPLLAARACAAWWLGREFPGQRCGPLWSASLRERAAARSAMRRHGLDRWFAMRPAHWRAAP